MATSRAGDVCGIPVSIEKPPASRAGGESGSGKGSIAEWDEYRVTTYCSRDEQPVRRGRIGAGRSREGRQEGVMHWLRKLWDQLFPLTPTEARRPVNAADRALANLRAKVRALPPEERAAFAKQIQTLIDEQAHARNDLSDALDDRHDR
jgi:hypothetical protein